MWNIKKKKKEELEIESSLLDQEELKGLRGSATL